MKINAIKVGGFANIEQVTIFDTMSSAFVAPNNYGKSNVLSAIAFGTRFMCANEVEKRRMMQDVSVKPINKVIEHNDFLFEIEGSAEIGAVSYSYIYRYSFAWAHDGVEGCIKTENLRAKQIGDPKYRLLISREEGDRAYSVPSITGRCNKGVQVSRFTLALNLLVNNTDLFYHPLLRQLSTISVPYLNTLENPNVYFSADGRSGLDLLDGDTVSSYLYKLKAQDVVNFNLLKSGIMQLLPNLESFDPVEISLGEGVASKVYDIRIKEWANSQSASIRQMSSGSKRVIFILTMCMVANSESIPMLLIEEPENSIHPRLLQNLLTCMRGIASDTKLLMTSHSTYLMRYFDADRLYLGVPNEQGLATFSRLKPGKVKTIYRRASEMDITFGEYMYELLLDMEDNASLSQELFQK